MIYDRLAKAPFLYDKSPCKHTGQVTLNSVGMIDKFNTLIEIIKLTMIQNGNQKFLPLKLVGLKVSERLL